MDLRSKIFKNHSEMKSYVMDSTQKEMAYLAHYLGYWWCGGGPLYGIGEGFVRDGDTLRADHKNGILDGYRKDERLALAYGDWRFSLKEIKYDDPLIEELTPESLASGTIYNHHDTEVTESFEKSETCVRSVTHTTTSEWKGSAELGITITYKAPEALKLLTGGFGGSASFKFNYESSNTEKNENSQQQSNTMTIKSSKTLKPHSAVKWDLVVSKTKTSVSYTAVIRINFSTELQGYLRWGGGPKGKETNYNFDYRGKDNRPPFNYRFGDSEVPFYTALKRDRDTNNKPWLWKDMEHAYPEVQKHIDALVNEDRYVFTLTGRFEDLMDKKVDIHWETLPD